MKHLLSLLLFFILLSTIVVGQDTRNPNTKFLTKRGYNFPDSGRKNSLPGKKSQWPDTVFYNTMYKPRLMGSLTIPITFTSIQLENESAIVSPNISLGMGYTWFYGDFIFNEYDKMTIEPTFFFGVLGDAGIENNFSLNKLAGFFAGGFVGFGAFTLFVGYDIINKYPLAGIGGRVDFFTISQKFLHVFGKVKEVRKHKSIALPITGE
jgi:hypothetical protein